MKNCMRHVDELPSATELVLTATDVVLWLH
jgi:hypothetical protein